MEPRSGNYLIQDRIQNRHMIFLGRCTNSKLIGVTGAVFLV
jgi:hypothetical protein